MSLAGELALAAFATSAIVAARYLLASGAAAWATRALRPGLYATRQVQIARELRWSLLAATIYGAPAGLVLWVWAARGGTRIYSDAAAYPGWWLLGAPLAYLLLHDAWFYWTHRLLHRPALFRRMHAVHHADRVPTAWTAMAFHPWEALLGAVVLPALVFVIPIHWAALAAVAAIATLFGVANHMGWEVFPRFMYDGPIGRWLITASHHQRHHKDYRCNYGLYFRFWDRACGTDRGLHAFAAAAAGRGTQ